MQTVHSSDTAFCCIVWHNAFVQDESLIYGCTTQPFQIEQQCRDHTPCVLLFLHQVAKAMSDYLGPEASVKVCVACMRSNSS
jgi:hypothetical protein